MRDHDLAQESGIRKLANIATRVKPTSCVESTSKNISKCAQTQNILAGTINIKCENTGTTLTTGIKSSAHRSGDISSTCGTADILAGTSAKEINIDFDINIDSDIELAGTTTPDKFKVTNDFSLDTTERVIGSIQNGSLIYQIIS